VDGAGLRVLKVAVIAMGVLIVAGVAILATLIVGRVAPSGGGARAFRLDEPAGTGVANATLSGDRMLVVLRGGGPDRVVVLDMASGRVLARIGL